MNPCWRRLVPALMMGLLMAAGALAIDDARLLRSPDVYGDRIVFVYGGDLWTAPVAGGDAVRLTTHPGTEENPFYSPDGQWIAFDAEYDGNTDVYIIPATGGEPQRLTYHPYPDTVTGWSPDGRHVVFGSSRESLSRSQQLYRIAVDGVFPEPLPFPMAFNGDYSPDGAYYAYNPLPPGVFQAWRRYRGGTAPSVWIFSFADNSVKMVPRTDSNDVYPQWAGSGILFLSDRDRVLNLYRYDPVTDTLTQLTAFKGADIKTFGTDGRTVVFEREGWLHAMNPADGQITRLTVNIPNEQLNRRPRFVKAERLIFNADISPTGQRAVFEARGEIVTVPAEKGDVRNITRTDDRAERRPAWSPDGAQIAYFGEHDGEYVLKIVDQKGLEEPRIVTLPEPTFYYDLVWSPDSRKLAFNDVKQNLYMLDLATEKVTTVDTDPQFLRYPTPVWSPDSRWLVYTRSATNRMQAIYLYSVEDGQSHQLTDAMSFAADPVFDKSGKYLYFTASTDVGLDMAWLDMSSHLLNPTNNLYVMVLAKDEVSPFAPESDDEPVKDEKKADAPKEKADAAAESPDEPAKEKKAEKAEEKVTRIDLDGIGQRILAIDVPAGRYSGLQVGQAGELYYLSREPDGRGAALHLYNVDKRKDEEILANVFGYSVSRDGKKLLYRSGPKWAITDAGKKVKPGDGVLKTGDIQILADPEKEFRQMLYEAWRINRDFFYDPGMHGHDWPAVWQQYEVYLPYVAHRSDLSYLINMMIGEYTCGHARNRGGMYPEVDRVPGGLLGADFEVADGRYRIRKIYFGENWNPDLRAPLTAPGLDVKEGEFILEVNGQPLTAEMNIYSLFQNTADHQVTLKIGAAADGSDARLVTVVPVSSETTLRHREWIEQNRQKVAEWSGGKVGYVYLPNTSSAGYDYFTRYYFAQLEKEAIVLDERFNGGGYVADYIINTMNRPFLSWWQPRYGAPFASPNNAHFGPKVMIINEMAGSGGDFMPWAFRETGIGKLVGKRTWGGLVGVSGYPPLMDGGYVTAPSFGIVSKDGDFIIENEGVPPDYEVEYLPADYMAGHDPQLKKAVDVVMEEMKDKTPPKFKSKGYPRGR